MFAHQHLGDRADVVLIEQPDLEGGDFLGTFADGVRNADAALAEADEKIATLEALLRKAAGVDRGSATTGREKVGTITRDQLREIATIKLADLNANDIDAAMRQVEGTARSMGIEVAG